MLIDTEYFCAVAFCHVTVANVTGKKMVTVPKL